MSRVRRRRRPDRVARLLQQRRELVAGLDGLLRIDLAVGDGAVPVAHAVARRQGGRIEAEFVDGVLVPADLLQPLGGLAPGEAGGDDATVALLDAAADQDVQQAEEVTLGGAALLEGRQKLLYPAHCRGSASVRHSGAAGHRRPLSILRQRPTRSPLYVSIPPAPAGMPSADLFQVLD